MSKMTCNNSFSKSFILRRHRPGDMSYVTYRHGEIYTKEYSYDAQFESLASRIIAEVLNNLQPNLDRCLIAEKDGVYLGCIMLVHDRNPKTAKLRLFLVDESARGFAIGTSLIRECIKFARETGYAYIDLWTESNLEGARRSYSRAGFSMVRTENYDYWGVELVSELWNLKLLDLKIIKTHIQPILRNYASKLCTRILKRSNCPSKSGLKEIHSQGLRTMFGEGRLEAYCAYGGS